MPKNQPDLDIGEVPQKDIKDGLILVRGLPSEGASFAISDITKGQQLYPLPADFNPEEISVYKKIN